MAWEDSQQPWEVKQVEQPENQTETQPELKQPPRIVHCVEEAVVTSVHTFPMFWSLEDEERMAQETNQHPWDRELNEDP